MNEQKQYRDELLDRCQAALELNWERLNPRLSKLFVLESLKEWEEACRQLQVKLQEEITADSEEYKIAKNLYVQMGNLYREANADQEELECYPHLRLKNEEDTDDDQENMEMEIEFEQEINTEERMENYEEDLEMDSALEEIEVDLEQDNGTEEEILYRDELLEWCNNLYSNWNRMKMSFSSLVDTARIEEWEEGCRQLKEKLEAVPIANYEDYEAAITLFEQWERLLEESYALQEEVEV